MLKVPLLPQCQCHHTLILICTLVGSLAPLNQVGTASGNLESSIVTSMILLRLVLVKLMILAQNHRVSHKIAHLDTLSLKFSLRQRVNNQCGRMMESRASNFAVVHTQGIAQASTQLGLLQLNMVHQVGLGVRYFTTHPSLSVEEEAQLKPGTVSQMMILG